MEPASDEQPDFLPMFPWYSGTSADMYRTIFGLVVSLKLFLGRFDMRTMQVVLTAWLSCKPALQVWCLISTQRPFTCSAMYTCMHPGQQNACMVSGHVYILLCHARLQQVLVLLVAERSLLGESCLIDAHIIFHLHYPFTCEAIKPERCCSWRAFIYIRAMLRLLHTCAGKEMVSHTSTWRTGSMCGLTSALTQEMEGELPHALTEFILAPGEGYVSWQLQCLGSFGTLPTLHTQAGSRV